jgi:hypothetical protein
MSTTFMPFLTCLLCLVTAYLRSLAPLSRKVGQHISPFTYLVLKLLRWFAHMIQNHPHSPSSSTTAGKRRRKQLVCSNCRDRKVRCNGQRPSCSSCARRKMERSCVYEEPLLGAQRSVYPLELSTKIIIFFSFCN